MTEVTHDSGIVHVAQGHKVISFRPADLTYESRRALIDGAKSITPNEPDEIKCDGCGRVFHFGNIATKVEEKVLCQKCFNATLRKRT